MLDALHSLTLDGLLEEHRRSHPERIAAVFEHRVFTYPQLADRVIQLSNALLDAGVASGDRVLWMGQNTHVVLETLLACARIGALFCPLNWRQTAGEMAFVIDDLEPRLVIWQQQEIGATVQAAKAQAQWQSAQWIPFDATGSGSYETFVTQASKLDRLAAEQRISDASLPCLLMYTAAFSGRPNGALLSQSAFLWQNLSLIDIQALSSQTVFLNSGPLFHIGTLMVTMATFHIGGTNVFIRRTDPEAIAEHIHNHRCTLAFLVGKTQNEIVKLNRDGRYDLKCLRSPCFSPEWDAMVTPTSERSLFGFGQTEVGGPVVWCYYGWGQCTSRNGRTGPVAQVRVFNADGVEAAPGEVGELAVRGPTVMSGYWRRPEINARRQRGGWHYTNDLGKRELDGSISFVGPKTQMIKSMAENVYPAEVENCLRQHAAVADCGIIGVPDDKWVQSVKAIVQLKPGASATAAELIEHCRASIASYKKPRHVEFVDSLPRTALGSIDYAALDQQFGGGNYPGGMTPGA
jgi:acyl-CoA synthetase (AMP-forming)/AMP-acid ligase II